MTLPEGPRQAAAFPAVYEQQVHWGECDDAFGLTEDLTAVLKARAGVDVDAFECAMIDAPLDWNDPGNEETIQLAAVHVPATGGAKIGTLFSNPGGPGESGIDFLYGMTASPSFRPVMAQYDLIGFDPRGVGRSSRVDCPEVSSIFEVRLAVCAQEQPLARSMGTSQVARDMDLMRALQGEGTLDYLGYSYGTILGATYSTLFPETVGRMVLDSAPDHTWASPSGNYDQSVAMVEEVLAMLQDCSDRYQVAACPVRTQDDLAAMLTQIQQAPLLATDGTAIGGPTLFGYLQSALYNRDAGRAEALDTLGRALAGDQTQIDDIARSMAGGGATVSMAGTIVRCHSLPRDPDIVGLLQEIERKGVPELLGGPEITDEVIRPFADLACNALAESGDDLESFSGPADVTILVIGITGDHATPFENGRGLAQELGNTRFLTLDGHGHAASFLNRSTCIDEATTAFLLTGELPPEGKVCADG